MQVSTTWALTCPETVHRRPCRLWQGRSKPGCLSDSRVGNNSVVYHRSRRPVLSPLRNCVDRCHVWPYWASRCMHAVQVDSQRHQRTQANLDGLRWFEAYCQLPLYDVEKEHCWAPAAIRTAWLLLYDIDWAMTTSNRKYWAVWICGFWNTRTDKHTDTIITLLSTPLSYVVQSAPRSRQKTTPKHITQFLQAGCSSWCPTNTVKTRPFVWTTRVTVASAGPYAST